MQNGELQSIVINQSKQLKESEQRRIRDKEESEQRRIRDKEEMSKKFADLEAKLKLLLGQCWGRHLRLSPKVFGCEQGGGEASCEGKEVAPEGPEAKGDKRRLVLPEEKRRGGVRSEGAARAPKGQTARRLREPLRWNSEDLGS